MKYRIGIDTGGTFTDAVITDATGRMVIGKAATTPERVGRGVVEALGVAAREIGVEPTALLAEAGLLIYGTTHATNAIVEGKASRTAFLVTEGHGDMLVLREGTKENPFDFRVSYPKPYVPKSLTFEIPERLDAEGDVVVPLDEQFVRTTLERLERLGVEAIGVCFLWSIANPVHERRVAELIDELLPDASYTLSHELVGTIREYRRASTTVIDASIKKVMQSHLHALEADLAEAGFTGELLVATSMGGVMHAADVAQRPVLTVRSGPSLAPVAGELYAREELDQRNAIVCDAGGTTFEVSLVRDGKITTNSETWLGKRDAGHIIATSSVDTRSIGAGGGSIAWIDSGGMLRVGPRSAGAEPGPACYGRGGELPTVTDAAVILGYLQPDLFLGGRMQLDRDAAERAVGRLAERLDQSPEETAVAVMTVAQFNMVTAIHEITVHDGIDPRESVLVSGGGSAGLNIVPIAEALQCPRILVPRTASALSASGAQFSDIVREFSVSSFAASDRFDLEQVNEALAGLEAQVRTFAEVLEQRGYGSSETRLFGQARYAHQVWEQETPLPVPRFESEEDVGRFVEEFHRVHERIFAFRDAEQAVECPNWKARFVAHLPKPEITAAQREGKAAAERRPVYQRNLGWQALSIMHGDRLHAGSRIEGPALLVEPFNTVVLHQGWAATVTTAGSYLIEDQRGGSSDE